MLSGGTQMEQLTKMVQNCWNNFENCPSINLLKEFKKRALRKVKGKSSCITNTVGLQIQIFVVLLMQILLNTGSFTNAELDN